MEYRANSIIYSNPLYSTNKNKHFFPDLIYVYSLSLFNYDKFPSTISIPTKQLSHSSKYNFSACVTFCLLTLTASKPSITDCQYSLSPYQNKTTPCGLSFLPTTWYTFAFYIKLNRSFSILI